MSLHIHEIKLAPSFSLPVRQNYSTSQWISVSLELVSADRLRSESEHTANPLLNQKSLKKQTLCSPLLLVFIPPELAGSGSCTADSH